MSIALDFVPATSTPSLAEPDDQVAGLACGRRGRGRAGRRRVGASRVTPERPLIGQLRPRAGWLGSARVGAAARGAAVPARRLSRRRRPGRPGLAALDRGALDEQVAHHRHEPRVGARRRHPYGVEARAARPSPGPRCRGRRRPPCGRRRSRSGPARPSSTPSPASFSRWSLTSGSSHGTCGGPEREQNTRSWLVVASGDLATRSATYAAASRCWAR